jgi:hypothetical protein
MAITSACPPPRGCSVCGAGPNRATCHDSTPPRSPATRALTNCVRRCVGACSGCSWSPPPGRRRLVSRRAELSKESTMVSHTRAHRYRGPATILLVLAVLGGAGSPAWGRVPRVLGTLSAALRGPVYTVAQLQRAVARDPDGWDGRQVLVQGRAALYTHVESARQHRHPPCPRRSRASGQQRAPVPAMGEPRPAAVLLAPPSGRGSPGAPTVTAAVGHAGGLPHPTPGPAQRGGRGRRCGAPRCSTRVARVSPWQLDGAHGRRRHRGALIDKEQTTVATTIVLGASPTRTRRTRTSPEQRVQSQIVCCKYNSSSI